MIPWCLKILGETARWVEKFEVKGLRLSVPFPYPILSVRFIGLLGKVGYVNSSEEGGAADERLLGVVLAPETHLNEESCFLNKPSLH